MRRMTLLLVAAMFALPLAVQAQSSNIQSDVVQVKQKAGAPLLASALDGMTLYVYDSDTVAGKSACNGPCATNWPPLLGDPTQKPVGKYMLITRDDGSMQWAYNGKPLYYWRNDKAPGDTTGEGVAGKWHVAKP